MPTLFPKWTNQLPTLLLFATLGFLTFAIGAVWYYFTPKYWEVGYMPTQPGRGFSHQIHAGKLGMDCRYCHSHIEVSTEANIPPVSTCYGCHGEGYVSDSVVAAEKVQFIRDAYANDAAIPWRRVHHLPQYVRNFPHHVHVQAGVSCYSCHGNIANQAVVHQVESLSMGWCLECHRNPEPHLVPRDKVTDLYWVRDQIAQATNPPAAGSVSTLGGTPGGKALLNSLAEKPFHMLPENCGACHY